MINLYVIKTLYLSIFRFKHRFGPIKHRFVQNYQIEVATIGILKPIISTPNYNLIYEFVDIVLPYYFLITTPIRGRL
jgi:hypothetical protein